MISQTFELHFLLKRERINRRNLGVALQSWIHLRSMLEINSNPGEENCYSYIVAVSVDDKVF